MKIFSRMLAGVIFLALLAACGGGGDTAAAAPTNTDCVLGASKIGDCTL